MSKHMRELTTQDVVTVNGAFSEGSYRCVPLDPDAPLPRPVEPTSDPYTTPMPGTLRPSLLAG